MAPFDRSHTSSYSSSIVTTAVSCTVFDIKQGIGRKTPPTFYRATRMHSAHYAVARCLSVCMSHAGILSTPLNISQFFLPTYAPFQFSVPNIMAIFRRGPPNGASNARGYKNRDFQPISRFIFIVSYRFVAVLTKARTANIKPYTSLRMVPFPMTLSDPNLDFKVMILFNVK